MKKIQKHLTKHLRGVLAVALTAAVVVSVAAVTSSQNLHAEFPVYAAEGDESTQSVSEPTEPQNTEPQSTDTQSTDTQNTGTQTAEPQTTETQNTEQQNTEPAAAPATDPQPSTPDSEPLTAPAAAQSATTKYAGKSGIPKYNPETGKIDASYKYATVEPNGTLNENNFATFPQDYKDAYLDGYSFDLSLPTEYTENTIVKANGMVFLGWKESGKIADTDPFVTKVTVTDESALVTLIPIFSTYSITTLPGYTHENKTLTFSWNYISETGGPSDDTLQTVLSDSTLITFLQNGYSTGVSKFPTVFDQYKSTPYPDTGNLEAYKGKYFIGWSLKSNASGINDVVTYMTITHENNGQLTLYPVFGASQYRKLQYVINFLDKSRATLSTITGSVVYDGANDEYKFYDENGSVVTDIKAPAASSTVPSSTKWETDNVVNYTCTVGQSIKDYLLNSFKKSSTDYLFTTFTVQSATTSTTKSTASNTSDSQVKLAALPSDKIPTFVQKIAEFDKSFNKNTKNIAFYDISRKTDSSGKTKAFIPYPAAVAKNYKRYEFTLYHWKDNGYVEEIYPLTLDEDGVWFESDSFSPFALTWATKRRGSSTGSPNTGDDFNPLPIVIIAGVAAVGVVAVLVIKKKKDSAQ